MITTLQQIERAVEYIESNLETDLDFVSISRAAGMSSWHFQRTFKALTKESLKTYIRNRRLANALDLLTETDARIVDISLQSGFSTQQSFTRAFKNVFGITPKKYRQLGRNKLFVKKLKLDHEYLKHVQDSVSVEPVLVEQTELELVGMKTAFFGVESEKNNIGEKLPPLWDDFLAILEPLGIPSLCYGVVAQYDPETEQLEYFAATERSSLKVVPDEFETFHVPPATYAHFVHRGLQSIDHTVNYIYGAWLCNQRVEHTYGPDLEIYGKNYDPTSNESEIGYAIPVSPR